MARVTRIDVPEHEGWQQLVCLLVSIALHVALGVVGWHGFGPAESNPEPVVVALVGRPAPLPAGPAPAARGRRQAAVPATARGRSSAPATMKATPVAAPVAMPQPVAAPVTVEPTASVEVPAETMPIPAGGIAAEAGGGGHDDGSQAGIDAGGGGAGGAGLVGSGGGGSGNLVRATPRYESNPPPPYPRIARQNRWEGTVRLRARVTAVGRVEGVSLERSSGHEVLDRAALEGVRGWRFIPATRGGVPVACEVSIPVAFRLTE